jgi:cobalamin biosynthesis protein CobT
MSEMPQEIHTGRARYNDDGWALIQASNRLQQEHNDCKFLLALSDGRPEPSSAHATREFGLSKVVQDIRNEGKQVLIGLGIGSDTGHVSHYYPNSVANIDTAELPKKLAAIIEQAIRHPEQFRK